MINLINQSEVRMPRQWMEKVFLFLEKELKLKADLTVVFLDPKPAQELNWTYRKKKYPTDVLSFESGNSEELGELILCPQVLQRQAKEHELSFNAELAYMLIHGVLHLLGHDHEKSKREATKMFRIQDQLFDRLRTKFHI
jgi:probable rRNA maturation factor